MSRTDTDDTRNHADSDRTSASGTSVRAASDSRDTRFPDSPSSLPVSSLNLREDDTSAETTLKTRVSAADDDIYDDGESTDTLPLLDRHSNDEQTSSPVVYPPSPPSFQPSTPLDLRESLSTRDSQPQSSARDTTTPVEFQPQRTSRAPVEHAEQLDLNDAGNPHQRPAVTFAHTSEQFVQRSANARRISPGPGSPRMHSHSGRPLPSPPVAR